MLQNRTSLKSSIIIFLLALLLFSVMDGILSLPVLAAEADHHTSRVYVVVDTALADSSDTVELDVMLFAPGHGLVTDKSVYGASSRRDDSISVGANEEGLIKVEISSSSPGVSQIALSLVSQDAAARFLQGTTGSYEGKILQTSTGVEIFSVYFIAGSLDPEYCLMEFDKDTIAVTDHQYSDNAIGTIYLRTEIDQPVANQRVRIYTRKSGVLLYPALSSSTNTGEGSSISLVTDKNGTASFVVRGYEVGDAEIFCEVEGEEFSEFLYIDVAENVFDLEDPDWDDYEDEEEEEEELIISRENTRVNISKSIALEYGSNARYNLPTTEAGWDKIVIGGTAMTADDEPVRGQHLVQAYATAGNLDKNTTLTTSNGGAFSFSLSSKEPALGRYAVGLGTVEQLKGYLEGKVSADDCQLLGTGMYAFIGHDWNKYMICAIGEKQAIINGYLEEMDVAPFIQNGRTMMIARPIANTIDAISKWDQAKQTASFYVGSGNYTIAMKVGSSSIDRTETYVAPKQFTSDVPAMVKDGRTVLPLRALSEAFEMKTIYDAGQQLVAVYNTAIKYPPPYNPKKDPNHADYDPTIDPNSDQYDATKDPDSDEYIEP
ncbi:MAG: copper amine oxidase N-terminal domain-containing protein [Clostridiales bacterium]